MIYMCTGNVVTDWCRYRLFHCITFT